MNTLNFGIGQRVSVKCPAYKNGRKLNGVITATFPLLNQSKIRIDGNKKSTILHNAWITPTK